MAKTLVSNSVPEASRIPDGGGAFWRSAIAPYEQASNRLAAIDLLTSAVPYLLLTAVMYALLPVSVWASLALAVPAGAFLLRTFIVFHDCTHGSFMPSRRANLWVGRITGFLVFQPFANWRHNHAVHHGTAGDLDRRGTGDIETLTLTEYLESGWRKRLGYRLFRNPVVMFGLGPIWSLMIGPRLWNRRMRPRQRQSVIVTNLAMAAVVGAIWLTFGPTAWLLVQLPAAIIAGTAGVWLFYVQHQFEDVAWARGSDWSHYEAAMTGSSFYDLPAPLRWITGNIGIHHIHHLNSRIPYYRLPKVLRDHPELKTVGRLTLWDSLKGVRLSLWCEKRKKLVSFRAAARM